LGKRKRKTENAENSKWIKQNTNETRNRKEQNNIRGDTMIKNPFKTKNILIITPTRKTTIKVPFLGKITTSVEKIHYNIHGQHYNNIIIDER
jgi:hypothetical protein